MILQKGVVTNSNAYNIKEQYNEWTKSKKMQGFNSSFSNLKSKRLLTFIFSIRISFWLPLLPWPQGWGHTSLVSWLRVKIYSIFWLSRNNFLKVNLSLWLLILIWLLSDVIWSSLKNIRNRSEFFLDLMMKYQIFHHLFF